MERTHTYADRRVCGRCYRRLTGRANLWPFVRLGVVCLAIGFGLGVLTTRSSRQQVRVPVVSPLSATRLQPPASQPLVAATTKPGTGNVSGSVWVNRTDGASDIPRGLRVSLIRGTVARPAVEACIRAEIALWEKNAAENESRAKAVRDQQSGSTYDFGTVWADEARYARAKIQALKKLPAALPEEMNVANAYQIVAGCSPSAAQADWARWQLDAQLQSIRLKGEGNDYAAGVMDLVARSLTQLQADWVRQGTPSFDDAVAANLVREATIDAAGKYSLTDVPAGDYVVHARLQTEAFFAEWLVPVRVTGGDTAPANLFKQNAIFSISFTGHE
jgi:hypothetical protein